MLVSAARRTTTNAKPLALLRTGDRLTQPEFHRRYEGAPSGFKAELLGGKVYVASPLKIRHGASQPPLATLLFHYESATPGTGVYDNTTVLLGPDDEPQPDLLFRVLPEYGGRSKDTLDGYVAGAPELFAQIADSTRSLDLGERQERYRTMGIREYIVLTLADQQLYWIDFTRDRLIEPDAAGVAQSRVFPGLWIDVPALFSRRLPKMLRTLRRGLRSPEHGRFIARLRKQHERWLKSLSGD